jgi:hypothetical protein
MPLPTLLDVAKRNASDPAVGLIDEASRMVPEITGQTMIRGQLITVANVGAARTIRGTQYKTRVRTSLPSAGFRDANEGVDSSGSVFENRLVECFILNPRWECDVAVANSNEDGAEAYIAEEALAVTNAAMMALGKQFYYGRGTGGHVKGHPGLIDAVDSSMVVDATGSTASTGSSVWGVSFGLQKVQWVLGMEGSLSITDPRIESITVNSLRFSAYVQEMLAHVGVQVGNKFSIGRIKNLTAQGGKGLTDALLGSLVSKYPVGYSPDVLFCSRRSLEQLRAARTATNATGTEAPTPTDYQGIPLVPTDSILDTEAIA